MKRIILCMALSVISLAIAIGSFLTQDVAAYKHWIFENVPRAAEKFDRHMHKGPDEKRPPMKEKKHEAPPAPNAERKAPTEAKE